MASPTFDNVISFGEQREQRRRELKPESIGVMNDCRDMALKRITGLLASTLDKIEEELFDLASKSFDRSSQNMYLDARAQAREKRGDIEVAFRKQFLSFFEKKVAGQPENKAGRTALNFDASQLSLVEDDTLSENIAVNDIAKRLTDKCDEELRALSQRMGFLMSEPELADDANPIAPDTVVRALKAACDQMTAGFQTKLTVLRLVEQHMAQDMLALYRDINAHLVTRQILPTIRPSYRKAQPNIVRRGAPAGTGDNAQANHSAEASASNAASGADFGASSASGQAGPSTHATHNAAADIYATLQSLIAGGTPLDARAHIANIGFSGVTTGSFAPQPAFAPAGGVAPGNAGLAGAGALGATGGASRISSDTSSFSSHALVAALSQMQQRLLSEHTTSNAATAAAVHAMQHFVPGQTSVSELNVLRQIKNEGLLQHGNPLDTMTIDIVAMLFDYVFDDKAIPDSIKALIARLQIPVLKVAILDKAFFSKKNHAVRRLLDALADASVAFAGEASKEDPLYKKIEYIVDRVHTDFETDLTLFDKMHEELTAFLAERETANAAVIEQSARALHEREKREMARLIGQAEAEQRGNQADLPPPVAAMLRGPWARVLERLYLREGGRNERFNEALDTADQLIWSVQPKVDATQRKALVTSLPNLLRRLQEGLEIAAVEQIDRQRFFATLVDCHAAAVKAGLRGESVAQLFATLHPTADVAPLFEKLIAEEKAREAKAKDSQRSGVARIQFTDNGVDIEEILPNKPGVDVDDMGGVAQSIGIPATETDREDATHLLGTGEHDAGLDFDVTDLPVQELKRGTWVEFVQETGKKLRAKLSWISPLKGVYLFTNPGANEALSIAPDALQQLLQRGVARVIEESSLMDRAVDRMVHSLADARS